MQLYEVAQTIRNHPDTTGQLLVQSDTKSGYATDQQFWSDYLPLSERRADLCLIECDTNPIG